MHFLFIMCICKVYGEIPWRRAWPPTPIFLLGESHGQKSLVDYSPWGCKVGHDLVTEQACVLVLLVEPDSWEEQLQGNRVGFRDGPF